MMDDPPDMREPADLPGGLPTWMLEPRTPRTVNDGETDACWICGDPDDHGGLPHSEAIGDGLTRYDIVDRLAPCQPLATEPCSDCRGQGGAYGQPCPSCFGTGELPKLFLPWTRQKT